MAESDERTAGIKRLEKRKGRLWGFMKREPPGVISPLTPAKMTRRLRHLMMSTIKTTSSFLRGQMGEGGLTSMFEHQAEEFASTAKRFVLKADKLARDTIVYNFQPLGIEATYTGDAGEARIVVESCPLPQRFLKQPEFLEELTFDEGSRISGSDFASDSLTSKGEWPPKKLESCSVCRVVMPRMGERLGFQWERGTTGGRPPKCTFTITVKPGE